MEWLLVVAVAVLVAWLVLQRGRRGSTSSGWEPTDAAALPPPTPAPGRPVRLSSFGRVPVLATAEHQAELAAAAHEAQPPPGAGRSLLTRAVVVPGSTTGGGPPAVVVRMADRSIGVLPPDTGYLPVVALLAERGEVGWCPARITRSAGGTWGAYLDAGEADVLLPRNEPDGLDLLEAHAPVLVTSTAEEQREVERLLGSAPRACYFAELDLGRVAGGRFAGEPSVEVLIDGAAVGRLTASVTQDYLAWVQPVLAAGARAGAEAILHRGSRGVQVTVHLPPIAD